MVNVTKYNETFFTSLFDIIKTEIENICIYLHDELLNNDEVKIFCTKIQNKIKDDIQTQNMLSSYVSCFYLFYIIKLINSVC